MLPRSPPSAAQREGAITKNQGREVLMRTFELSPQKPLAQESGDKEEEGSVKFNHPHPRTPDQKRKQAVFAGEGI